MAFDLASAKPVDETRSFDMASAQRVQRQQAEEAVMSAVERGKEIPEKLPEQGDPWYEDFAEGLAVSGMSLYYGLKDLVGAGSEDDRATLEDWKKDAAESGWGTAGRVAGELAQLAVPSGVALKGVRALGLAKTLGRAAPVATDIATGAALGAARLPEQEGGSRLGEAAGEAAAGAAFGTLGALGSRITKGLKRTPEAQKLTDEGVYLTVGQQAGSEPVHGLETLMEYTPFLAQSVKRLQAEGQEGWVKKVMQEANPTGASEITDIGHEGFKQLARNVEQGYKDAWQGATGASKAVTDDMIAQIDEALPVLVDYAPDLKKVKSTIKELAKGEPSGEKLRAIDNALRRRISKAGDKYDLQDELVSLRKTLRESLPRDVQAKLLKQDRNYPRYLTVRDAISRSKNDKGVFNPSQLSASIGKVSGRNPNRIAKGVAPMQQSMLQGRATVGREGLPVPLSPWRRLSAATPAVPVPIMRAMGRATMGETRAQRALQRTSETPVGSALRRYASPRRLGMALEDDE